MRVLELFSGTGSVGKVCKERGYEVISLDLKGADINMSILDWNYKTYPPGYFDIIWASPPCHTFSLLRDSWIGRKIKSHGGEVCSKELIQKDIQEKGLPIVRKAEEIIDYFKPSFYFIENPQTGRMKEYIDKPYYDVDYCKYADWGYRKRTRIWTNVENFEPKMCKKDCNSMSNGRHTFNIGFSSKNKNDKGSLTLQEKYRVPPKLINELFDTFDKD